MVDTRAGWEREVGRWPRPFLKHLGHKARQRMCPLYVAGLIGPGDRKSVQPMAERFAPGTMINCTRFNDILDGHIADLGGEANVSQAELSIARRAATITVELSAWKASSRPARPAIAISTSISAPPAISVVYWSWSVCSAVSVT